MSICFSFFLMTGQSAGVHQKPFVMAHYYTWYTTGTGPHAHWGAWGKSEPSLYHPQGASPERVLFPPYVREISSCAYPLVGAYDSDDPEVVRWHIRLAKAAGIDAFLVDWWGPANWQKPSGFTHDVFVKTVLPIAEEENFKVCLFDETPQFAADLSDVKNWIVTYLNQFKDSPAYLHFEGKPVYGIYQHPVGSLTPESATELRDYVEQGVGPIYWIVDKMLCRAVPPEKGDFDLYVPDDWLALSWVDCFMGYSTFGIVRRYEYEDVRRMFGNVVNQVHDKGHKMLLPVHPGHNNSKIATEPWVMPRRDGQTFSDYLRAAEETAPDFIAVTSFNEWPETTVIEPSRSWADPYQYLKILAQWKSIQFIQPEEPRRVTNPEILE